MRNLMSAKPSGPGQLVFGHTLLMVFTFMVGLVLSIMQLPPWLNAFRPAWSVLLIIYWVVMLPHRVGVTTAWCLGLTLDIMHGRVFGQHALGLCFVGFLSFLLHLRLRVFPMWQQMLTVFILTGMYLLITRIIQGLTGSLSNQLLYWAPSVTSALMWPLLLWSLQYISRKYRIQ